MRSQRAFHFLASAAILAASGLVVGRAAGVSDDTSRPPASDSKATADRDFAAFRSLVWVRFNPDGTPENWMPPPALRALSAENLTRRDENLRRMQTAGLAFIAAYPADPRRWEIALALLAYPPWFALGWGPDVVTKGAGAAIVDEPAKAAWNRRAEELRQELLGATDATPGQRETVEWHYFGIDFKAQISAQEKGQPYDYRGFRARFDAHVQRYAALDVVVRRAYHYLTSLERHQPGSSVAEWRHLLQAPNPALREVAAAQMRLAEGKEKPMELAFTAVDGREVDLKQLRGKVVLIDFWATWCQPCVQDLPTVRRVYQKYHDNGFEIVGITLERGVTRKQHADLAGAPVELAAKIASARKVLLEFTTREQMPWPQYFDGLYWDNPLAKQYAVNQLPTMFLLDRTGRLARTDVRADELEREIGRLLER